MSASLDSRTPQELTRTQNTRTRPHSPDMADVIIPHSHRKRALSPPRVYTCDKHHCKKITSLIGIIAECCRSQHRWEFNNSEWEFAKHMLATSRSGSLERLLQDRQREVTATRLPVKQKEHPMAHKKSTSERGPVGTRLPVDGFCVADGDGVAAVAPSLPGHTWTGWVYLFTGVVRASVGKITGQGRSR